MMTRISNVRHHEGEGSARPRRLTVLVALLLWSAVAGMEPACLSPTLTHDAFHIVVAGFEADQVHTHLLDIGLSNAKMFVYRRLEPSRPLSTVHGPCGQTVEERLLLPNHGREPTALWDYAVEHYDNPPVAVMFQHGHGPISWHTSCEAVFSRARAYYTELTEIPLLLVSFLLAAL